jgi:hypothetical protein
MHLSLTVIYQFIKIFLVLYAHLITFSLSEYEGMCLYDVCVLDKHQMKKNIDIKVWARAKSNSNLVCI